MSDTSRAADAEVLEAARLKRLRAGDEFQRRVRDADQERRRKSMPDLDTPRAADEDGTETPNEKLAREMCDFAVSDARKFVRAEMLLHWRVNRALRQRMVEELDARDAARREARAEIEMLKQLNDLYQRAWKTLKENGDEILRKQDAEIERLIRVLADKERETKPCKILHWILCRVGIHERRVDDNHWHCIWCEP